MSTLKLLQKNKTSNRKRGYMKNIKTIMMISLLSLINMNISVAQEINLPVISKPSVLDEGVQRELSDEQIAEISPWANDSKVYLIDLKDSLDGLSSADKLQRLVDGIKSIVGESSPKNSELFMRYILNRALVLNDLLGKEISAKQFGLKDIKLRVLLSSIDLAVKYYNVDMQVLSKKTKAPFVSFGVSYYYFLNSINNSILDASAQYAIAKTSLEWLQWDLYRDLNNKKYASQIVKINNSLKTLPATVSTDKQALILVRQMKSLETRLQFPGVAIRNNKPFDFQVGSTFIFSDITMLMNSDCGKKRRGDPMMDDMVALYAGTSIEVIKPAYPFQTAVTESIYVKVVTFESNEPTVRVGCTGVIAISDFK